MPNYAKHLTRPTQREPIFGQEQVANDAGGYVYEIDKFEALDRFLILGCEGGTFYTGESKMTRRAADIVRVCAEAHAPRTVKMIRESVGRAIKPDAAIFALAFLAGNQTFILDASAYALNAVSEVCRTGTQLFSFVDQVTQFRGWGRGLRRAIADWYTSKTPSQLAYQVTKYRQRGGWSHRDLLRLSHPVSKTLNPLFNYIVNGDVAAAIHKFGLDDDTRSYLLAIEASLRSEHAIPTARRIRQCGLVREHVSTALLNSPEVWEALLEKMPMTAMIRNLATMTRVGLISQLSEATKTICERLEDETLLKRARVHPFSLLLAKTTYESGRGFRGTNTWNPDRNIVAALESAFYKAFDNVEPTGKNFMLGIDISGSMGCRSFTHMGSIANTNIKAFQAAAAVAMVQAKTEKWCLPTAFTGNNRNSGNAALTCLENLGQHDSLSAVMKELESLPMGPTDCSLPMRYAMENKIPVDTFVVYTDNETWCGPTHPSVALKDYRQAMGRDAKLVVCAMTATNYSVADPNDPGMLDVVGFDSRCPAVISKFAGGE